MPTPHAPPHKNKKGRTGLQKALQKGPNPDQIQTKSRVFERLGHLWHPRSARDTIFHSFSNFF